jgi:hypothetical protein
MKTITKIMLIGLAAILIMPSAFAAEATILFPSGVISRSDPITAMIKITDFDSTSYWINDLGSIRGGSNPVKMHIVVSDGTRYYFVSSNVSLTGNGYYNVSIPSDQLPFDEHTYTLHVFINSNWDFNGNGTVDSDDITEHYGETGTPGWILADLNDDGQVNYLDLSVFVSQSNYPHTYDNANATFSIGGAGKLWLHEISFKSFDPDAYNLKALHVMRDGFRWKMTSNSSSETVYVFLTDGVTRGLIAYGTRSVSYTNNGTFNYLDKGVTWHMYQGKTSNGNVTYYQPRSPYYEYVGVCTDPGSYTWAGTRVTMLDATGVGGDTRELNFSMDNYNVGTPIYHNSVAKSRDFQGYFTYFETMPAPGEVISIGGTHGQASWMGMVRGYFTSFGMGWMVYLLGFIIVCLFVGSTYSFARKFNISVPNYIYVLMGTVGITAAWIIGFFDTWIYIFFIVILAFSLVLRYREPIEQALRIREIGAITKAEEAEVGYIGSLKKASKRIGKDVGVIVKRRRRKPQKRVPEADWMTREVNVSSMIVEKGGR